MEEPLAPITEFRVSDLREALAEYRIKMSSRATKHELYKRLRNVMLAQAVGLRRQERR